MSREMSGGDFLFIEGGVVKVYCKIIQINTNGGNSGYADVALIKIRTGGGGAFDLIKNRDRKNQI